MIDLLQTNRPRSAAAAVGTEADQPSQEEGTSLPPSVRVAGLLTEYSCGLCSLKTQFSFCHLAAPLCGWSSGARRPFAIVKDDTFLDWRQKLQMLEGGEGRETFQTIFPPLNLLLLLQSFQKAWIMFISSQH